MILLPQAPPIPPADRDGARDARPPRDEGAVERLLETLHWSVGAIERVALGDAESLTLEAGTATLVYVIEGAVRRTGEDATHAIPQLRNRPALTQGAVLFAVGRRPVALRARGDAQLAVARLRAAEDAERVLSAVPDVLWVDDFSALEPGVAAMAAHLGAKATGECEADGGRIVCRLMATTLVIATLRAWAAAGCAPADWAARAQDPFLARAVDAIHADPGAAWSVDRLAARAAMSRSAFAARFRATFGSAPAEYLTGVRMDLAKSLLRDPDASVSAVARRLGYESDEGFSRAFRRHTGETPSSWRARSAGHATTA
ncbi:AraC family transcriptional regulator [Microbacterium paludicola]|uniref:AraC family transcriptional regulator n=1 Tax=Microbacterium paludicola TaxID=300019 RepID=A0A4Y9FVL9_9MICO|nr:AraC family transcriptional regulator [Microbacterium paludicola]MBF0816003.1 helix-turn-helix transcriptional regulator [Microbacterium paludicola]TFU33323.1 AraC family transcriptional regulator [Microbacterium paludicola]